MTTPQKRLEALEAAASRLVTVSALASVANASGLDAREIEAEADRIMALTDGLTPVDRLHWMARDAGVSVAEMRRNAAAILAGYQDA